MSIEVFGSFVDFYVGHFCTSLSWRYKAYNAMISEIFTESDEVMAMLLLETNYDNFKKYYDIQWLLTRKEAYPKYIKVDSNGEIFRGWNTKDIRRFNDLVLILKINWNTDESKEIEIQLK